MTMSQDTRSQFFSFAMAGAAGFIVDTSALYAAMNFLGTGHYIGRVFSYLIAATSTWALNRRYTFRASRSSGVLHEWLKFLGANLVGGLINYATYAALVAMSSVVAAHPVIGVGAGSIAGLAANFTLSRKLVFTGAK